MSSGYEAYPASLLGAEQGPVASEFDIVKREIQEMSRQAGDLQYIGTLRSPENDHVWRGGISREKRLAEGGDLHNKQALVSETESRLNEFFVATTEGASKRCVDGRTKAGYTDTDPASYGAPLGPQLQGATSEEAVAYRYVKGPAGATTLADDVEQYISSHESEYMPGNHISDYCTPGGTGCGNLDSQEERGPWYGDSEIAAVVKDTTAAVMNAAGLTPIPGAFERMRDNAAELRQLASDYYANLNNVVAAVRKANPRGVELLPGVHNEMTVTINLIPGTTFHRDAYNALTGGLIQNFNFDAWHVFDEHPPEVAEAIVNDTIATLIKLTDGSLNVHLRTPKALQ